MLNSSGSRQRAPAPPVRSPPRRGSSPLAWFGLQWPKTPRTPRQEAEEARKQAQVEMDAARKTAQRDARMRKELAEAEALMKAEEKAAVDTADVAVAFIGPQRPGEFCLTGPSTATEKKENGAWRVPSPQ